MRDLLSTAGLILTIFAVITIMFVGPKGFSMGAERPIVTEVSEASD